MFDAETNQQLDHFDVDVWDARGWAMLNPNQDLELQKLLPNVDSAEERRSIAKSHVRKCLLRAKRFHRSLDVPATPPDGVTIHLFAGDAIPTTDRLASHLVDRSIVPTHESPGDRTVTRRSALADQRTEESWRPQLRSPIKLHDVRFIFADHFGLTSVPEFTDNVLYILLEAPRP